MCGMWHIQVSHLCINEPDKLLEKEIFGEMPRMVRRKHVLLNVRVLYSFFFRLKLSKKLPSQ